MLSEKLINKYKEYIGKDFGCIHVDDIDLSDSHKNRLYFLCTCKMCNRKLRIRNDGLTNLKKNTERVGCSKCMGIWRRKNFEEKYKHLLPKDIRDKFTHFRANANSRNIPFLLTKEKVIKLCESNCFYCGKPRCLGIDRLDNSKAYTNENCVPCCGCCNRIKMDLEFNFFINHIKKIYNNITNIESSTTISKESTSKVNVDGKGAHLTYNYGEDIVLSA